MLHQLKEVFPYICCFCEPSPPYNHFKYLMTEDFSTNEIEEAKNLALLEINYIF